MMFQAMSIARAIDVRGNAPAAAFVTTIKTDATKTA
jgi:hypothetical protein